MLRHRIVSITYVTDIVPRRIEYNTLCNVYDAFLNVGDTVPEQTEWETKAANLLKAELKRRGVTYAELAERIGDKEVNIRNKLSRGKFTAAFLLQSLCAIEAKHVEILE